MKTKSLIFSLMFFFGALAASAQMSVNTEDAEVKFYFVKDKVEGTVTGLSGKITFDPESTSGARFEGSARVATLTTGNAARDKHLMSNEFFDVKKYPTMKIVGTSVTKTAKGYTMQGKLTIKDVTKPITINFTYSERTFKGTATINAHDFGVSPSKKAEDGKVKLRITMPVR